MGYGVILGTVYLVRRRQEAGPRWTAQRPQSSPASRVGGVDRASGGEERIDEVLGLAHAYPERPLKPFALANDHDATLAHPRPGLNPAGSSGRRRHRSDLS